MDQDGLVHRVPVLTDQGREPRGLVGPDLEDERLPRSRSLTDTGMHQRAKARRLEAGQNQAKEKASPVKAWDQHRSILLQRLVRCQTDRPSAMHIILTAVP